MAINDDQLEDLRNQSVIDDDVVQTPSILPQSSQKLTVIPETEALRNQAVNLSKEYEAKLPTMDIQLKLVEGNQSRLVDMEDVEDTIALKGTADQTTADTVHEVFENFYGDTLKRGHFTAAPTQTNFPRIKNHMRNRIALEEAALVTNVKSMMKEPVEDAIAILTELGEKYLPSLSSSTVKLHTEARTLGEGIESAQNTIVRIDEEFINLATIPLVGSEMESGVRVFDDVRKDFKALFANRKLTVHLHVVANEYGHDAANVNAHTLEFQDKEICLKDIINYYRNTFSIQVPEMVQEQISVTIAKMEKEKEETKDYTGASVGDVKEYLTTHAGELKELSQYHVKTVQFVKELIELNYLADKLFAFFKTRL